MSETALVIDPPAYVISEMASELRQGEIITGLRRFELRPAQGEETGIRVIEFDVPYAIIASQDCDLVNQHNQRSAGKAGDLIGVLFFELKESEALRESSDLGSKYWKQVLQNKWERYHYLEKVDSDFDRLKQGITSLCADFKRYFTLEYGEIFRQLTDVSQRASRRCRLEDLYREQFQTRAGFYMQRVGLPRDHGTTLIGA